MQSQEKIGTFGPRPMARRRGVCFLVALLIFPGLTAPLRAQEALGQSQPGKVTPVLGTTEKPVVELSRDSLERASLIDQEKWTPQPVGLQQQPNLERKKRTAPIVLILAGVGLMAGGAALAATGDKPAAREPCAVGNCLTGRQTGGAVLMVGGLTLSVLGIIKLKSTAPEKAPTAPKD